MELLKQMISGSQVNHVRCYHAFTFKEVLAAGVKCHGRFISSNQVTEFVLCVLLIWKVVPDLHFG
jgi:hypothetical protein